MPKQTKGKTAAKAGEKRKNDDDIENIQANEQDAGEIVKSPAKKAKVASKKTAGKVKAAVDVQPESSGSEEDAEMPQADDAGQKKVAAVKQNPAPKAANPIPPQLIPFVKRGLPKRNRRTMSQKSGLLLPVLNTKKSMRQMMKFKIGNGKKVEIGESSLNLKISLFDHSQAPPSTRLQFSSICQQNSLNSLAMLRRITRRSASCRDTWCCKLRFVVLS